MGTTKVRQSRATLAPDSITTNHAKTEQERLENMANYVSTLHMDPNRQSESKYQQAINEATDLTHDLRKTITGLISDLEVKKQERKERKILEKQRLLEEQKQKEIEKERLRQQQRAQQFHGQIEQLKSNIVALKSTVDNLQKKRDKEKKREIRDEKRRKRKEEQQEQNTVIVIPVYYTNSGRKTQKRKHKKKVGGVDLENETDFSYLKRVDDWCKINSIHDSC